MCAGIAEVKEPEVQTQKSQVLMHPDTAKVIEDKFEVFELLAGPPAREGMDHAMQWHPSASFSGLYMREYRTFKHQEEETHTRSRWHCLINLISRDG